MQLLITGLNHKTASVDVRERVAVPGDDVPAALAALAKAPQVREVMIISTCNRLEVVCVPHGTQRRDAVEGVIEGFLAARGEIPREELSLLLYRHWGRDALHHLMRTAASLDSLVVGEPQILGQVKDAFEYGRGAGTVGSELEQTLQRVFHIAKRVRRESGIGRSPVSVGSMAAELAQRIFGDLARSDVALVGAGQMAELAAQKLQRSGARSITVLNRSVERAERLAGEHGWRAAPLLDLKRTLEDVDVVISSTGARGHVIGADMVREAMTRRRYRPLFLVDIALPRDIDPAVSALQRVYLYNIDDLEAVIAENRDRRQQEAERAEAWLVEEVDRFLEERRGQSVKPVIRALREHALAIAEGEVARTLKRMPDYGEGEQETLRRMAVAIVNKFLHAPMTTLKSAARADDGDRAVDWTLQLFGIDRVCIDSDGRDGDGGRG